MRPKVILPYPGNQPSDTLADALARIRVVSEVLGNNQDCPAAMASNLDIIIQDAIADLQPVLDLLNEIDPPGMMETFRQCRIARITSKGGAT